VALITGGRARAGRSRAVRLAEEGADIIAVDVAEDIESVRRLYPGASEADLAETVKEVEALDRRIVATKADVRDYGALKAAMDEGVAQLCHLDLVSAKVGIFVFGDRAPLSRVKGYQRPPYRRRRPGPRARHPDPRPEGRPRRFVRPLRPPAPALTKIIRYLQ
jgi:NAD(P)-dependent dehydrogenase (short-subunit alcohol dehydrogenase family)